MGGVGGGVECPLIPLIPSTRNDALGNKTKNNNDKVKITQVKINPRATVFVFVVRIGRASKGKKKRKNPQGKNECHHGGITRTEVLSSVVVVRPI
jgi:hypothetical protein